MKRAFSLIMFVLLLMSVPTPVFSTRIVVAEPSTTTILNDNHTTQETVKVANQEPPSTQWSKTYGGTEEDWANALVQTSDGGYALAGSTKSYGAGDCDFWLVKTDAGGNMQWSKSYGGAHWDEAYALVQTGDGGYALAGATDSFGAGWADFWLVKTDAGGNMQWSKTYGGTDDDYASALVQTGDGGYALAGSTDSYGAGGGDAWLVKTDAGGNMQWSKTYGGTDWDEVHALVQTGDGGYALAGSTDSYGAGGGDAWLVKTDAGGNMQWSKTYGGTDIDYAYVLVQTSDGGYALAGSTKSYSAGHYDFWLVKTDASGNAQWSKSYGGTNDDFAPALVQTSDGGYALAGTTGIGPEPEGLISPQEVVSSYALAGSTDSYGAGGYDFWLVKTDASGNAQWSKSYGGTNDDLACALVQTGDGGYALAGSTDSYGAGGFDFWLAKLAPESGPNPPAPSYPSDKWERIWYINNGNGVFGSYLGLGPHQSQLSFDDNWDTGTIAYGRADFIGFVSSRTIHLNAGTWRFTITTDDGVRLYIDDELVLDKWFNQYNTYTMDKSFASAGDHRFRIDWYEETLTARISFNMVLSGLQTMLDQLKHEIADAKQAALDFSQFNLNEGVDVGGQMIASVASDVAGLAFSDIVLPDLGVKSEELPKLSQLVLEAATNMLSQVTDEDLKNVGFASTLSRNVMNHFASNANMAYCTDTTQLSSMYEANLNSINTDIDFYAGLWRNNGPPSNLESVISYCTKLLQQFTASLQSAKSKAVFYISPNRIGTIGQSAEAIKWWNSPLHKLADYGSLSLSATSILLGQPEFTKINDLIKVSSDIQVCLIWWNTLQNIVQENENVLEDFYSLLWDNVHAALDNPSLYSTNPGEITNLSFPSVSYNQIAVDGIIKYSYNWPIESNLRAAAAFFDPQGELIDLGLSSTLSNDVGNLEFSVRYHFPGIHYLMKYGPNAKMSVKIFMFHMDKNPSSYDRNYLSGPFETEVNVDFVSLTILSLELDCPADLHVYDSQGRHVGLNYSSGGFDLQIPNTYYSSDASSQIILIPEPQGEYAVSIIGTASGSYNLLISNVQDGTNTDQKEFTDATGQDVQQTYSLEVSSDGNIVVTPEFPSVLTLAIFMVSAMLELIFVKTRKLRRPALRSLPK